MVGCAWESSILVGRTTSAFGKIQGMMHGVTVKGNGKET
jgi:hypothetical protein